MLTHKLGDKVIYKVKVYDFGYMGHTGMAILYKEGERNIQDSFAVDLEDIEPLHNNDNSPKRLIPKKDNE